MSTAKTRPTADELIPTADAPVPSDFPMEVSDYATATVRVASKVPDDVADLLEDLRQAHDREIKVKGGQVIPAGQPKFRVASFPTPELAAQFKKHALSYSKGVMVADGYSVRLSVISDTSIRVGVGVVVSKPRKPRGAESTGTES